MQLPKEAITEYRKIHIKHHGYIREEEATKLAISLLKLFKEIYKPIPEKKLEKDP